MAGVASHNQVSNVVVVQKFQQICSNHQFIRHLFSTIGLHRSNPGDGLRFVEDTFKYERTILDWKGPGQGTWINRMDRVILFYILFILSIDVKYIKQDE